MKEGFHGLPVVGSRIGDIKPPALLVVGKRIFQYKNLLCYNLRGLATAEKKA